MRHLLAVLLLIFSSVAYAAGNATLGWDFDAAQVGPQQVTGFSIERKAAMCGAAGAFTEVAVVGATLRTYTDTNLAPGTYCWRVWTVGVGGRSTASSNLVSFVVPVPAPSAPTNLIITFIQTLMEALETLKTGLLDLGQP